MQGQPSATSTHAFSDITDPSQNAAVSWMAQTQITTGTSPTTFAPNDTLTRAQLATFLHRYQNKPAATIDPTSPTCPAIAAGSYQPISGGVFHTCGIRADGTAQCWGLKWNGETDAPSGTLGLPLTGDGAVTWSRDRKRVNEGSSINNSERATVCLKRLMQPDRAQTRQSQLWELFKIRDSSTTVVDRTKTLTASPRAQPEPTCGPAVRSIPLLPCVPASLPNLGPFRKNTLLAFPNMPDSEAEAVSFRLEPEGRALNGDGGADQVFVDRVRRNLGVIEGCHRSAARSEVHYCPHT